MSPLLRDLGARPDGRRTPTDAAPVRIVSLAERPDLGAAIPGVLASRWPVFMLAGRAGHDVDLTALLLAAPKHQMLLLDADDEVLGVGLSVPLSWNRTVGGLPGGWDAAVTAGARLLERGGRPDAVCALSITMTPAASGRGHAAGMVTALKAAAASVGASALLAPVRPVLKARYPLTSITRYLSWRTEAGRPFDPWLRLHLGLGGLQVGIAHTSMTITGSVPDWQDWIDLSLPVSGEYVIPAGLVPLVVDRARNTARYREPNVWLIHRTG